MKERFLIILGLFVLLAIFIGGTVYLSKPLPDFSSYPTYTGMLEKADWSKTLESYCAQGSDYFVLNGEHGRMILNFEPNYSIKQMENMVGETIEATVKLQEKEIKCPIRSQCPETSDGIYRCQVYKVQSIHVADILPIR